MKYLLAVCMTAVIALAGCGEEEVVDTEKQERMARASRPRAYEPPEETSTESDIFSDHMRVIQASEGKAAQKALNIRRLAMVREDERPEAVAYLRDTVNSSEKVYERRAAALALIEMNDPQAMRAINDHLIFKKDIRFHVDMLRQVKEEYPADYRKMICAWAADALNMDETLRVRSSTELGDGMGLYGAMYEDGSPLVKPDRYLNEGAPEVAAKMMFLLARYPKDKIPVDLIGARIRRGIENKTITPGEIMALYAFQKQTKMVIPLTLTLEMARTIIDHHDYDMRRAGIRLLQAVWNSIPWKEQESLLEDIKLLAEADPHKEGDVYPVRVAAAEALGSLK